MLSEDDQVHVLQNYRGGTYRGQLRGGKPHGRGSWEGRGSISATATTASGPTAR